MVNTKELIVSFLENEGFNVRHIPENSITDCLLVKLKVGDSDKAIRVYFIEDRPTDLRVYATIRMHQRMKRQRWQINLIEPDSLDQLKQIINKIMSHD